ncbi:MAG: hypothetical protein U0792_12385 [Gemmataceae bacterium]
MLEKPAEPFLAYDLPRWERQGRLTAVGNGTLPTLGWGRSIAMLQKLPGDLQQSLL